MPVRPLFVSLPMLVPLLALLPVADARAQEGPPAPASAEEGALRVRPPELIEAAEAPYPAGALAARIEGRVGLLLTVDAEGRVVEAEVAEPLHPELDEAAVQAARASRFAPARRGEVPIAARIRFHWVFELPPGSIEGRLAFDGVTAAPAAGVVVTLYDQAGLVASTQTDESGAFRFEGVRHGSYRLLAGSPELGRAEVALVVEPAATTETSLRLLPPEEELEVTVEYRSRAERLRASAQAVQVIETKDDKRRTADLGEVLARSHGVAVRRDGGLGSDSRFALNGMEGDQIRFFLDGVPLHLAGYPFGLANVPVNLVERIEVYRGVVPIRFGADALGGAVNLVSDDAEPGTRGSASWQVGSFGTHRVAAGASHLADGSGLYLSAAGFFDVSDNDYRVYDVDVARDDFTTVRGDAARFHDGYRAAGGNVQAGFVHRPWARRLLVRAFLTDYTKELQHDALMQTPYGEVEYGGRTVGATLRYENELFDGLTLDLIGGFTRTEFWLEDLSPCTYSWSGRCLNRERNAELGSDKQDSVRRDRGLFARLNLAWEVAPGHTLRLSTSPTFFDRDGDNRLVPDVRDPLRRKLATDSLVSGVEYEADLFDERLENVFFVKSYYQSVDASVLRIGTDVDRNEDLHRFGAGDALRYRLADRLYAKASWEWATRMPSPDELFGDGVLVDEQLDLRPERSHNVNLGVTADGLRTAGGFVRGEMNLFLRSAEDLIARLFENNRMRHENVGSSRALGAEMAAGWTSPDEAFAVDGNLTWVDNRNTSESGTFARKKGDRIPNQPWLFANAALRLRLDRLAGLEHRTELAWNTRFVAAYFRMWESDGRLDSKERVPDQLVHTVAATWDVDAGFGQVSLTGEVQNLSDAIVFDSVGTQRPGRAFFLKTTAAF